MTEVQVGAAFFEPLPEDELAAWEGNAEGITLVTDGGPIRDFEDVRTRWS